MTLSDEKVRALSPHGKLLWFALLTHKHGSMVPGFVPVSVAVLAEDTDLSPKRVQREIDRMREAKMLRYDEAARLFWLPKAIHYNEPENPNVVKGWARQWANLPDSGLLQAAAETLMKVICERQTDSKNPENWTHSVDAFADASGTRPEPFRNPPPSPSPSPRSPKPPRGAPTATASGGKPKPPMEDYTPPWRAEFDAEKKRRIDAGEEPTLEDLDELRSQLIAKYRGDAA